MSVSFIICTYNGGNKIKQVVESIIKHHKAYNDFEIILVDNNSSDNVIDVFNLSTKEINSKVIIEKEQGLVFARIAGLKNASHDIVVFVDDDNYFISDVINEINLYFDHDIGAMGGIGILSSELDLEWFSSVSKGIAVGPQSKKGKIIKVESLYGACLCVRKELLLKYYNNNYIPKLTGRKGNELVSGEDSEISEMIKNLGYKCLYNENIAFIHDINITRINKAYFIDLYNSFGVAFAKILPFRYPFFFKFGYSFSYVFIFMTFLFLHGLSFMKILFFRKSFELECNVSMLRGAYSELKNVLKSKKVNEYLINYQEFKRIRKVK